MDWISSVLINYGVFFVCFVLLAYAKLVLTLLVQKAFLLLLRTVSVLLKGLIISEPFFFFRLLVHKREQHMKESCLVSAALYDPSHQLCKDNQFLHAFSTAVFYKTPAELLQCALLI